MNRKKEVTTLTEMKRVTISVPDWLDKAVLELRKDDRFVRCSYAEIVRYILQVGLEVQRKEGERG